jgi:hypothetical protein
MCAACMGGGGGGGGRVAAGCVVAQGLVAVSPANCGLVSSDAD